MTSRIKSYMVEDLPDFSTLAPLNSPPLTGTPTAPTPATGDNSNKIANTAYVRANLDIPPVAPLIGKATSTTALGITNWNDLTAEGHSPQLMLGSLTNGPGDSNYYYVEVRSYSGTELIQIGHQYVFGNNPRPMMIMRERYAGTWGSWRRLYAPEDKPSFFVRSHYTSNTGVSGVQIWTGVFHNVGNAYNITNGRFTAPVSGRYMINSSILSRQHLTASASIAVNGTILIYDEDTRASSNFGSAQLNTVLNLVAGDYVTLNSNSDNYGTAYSWWAGALL